MSSSSPVVLRRDFAGSDLTDAGAFLDDFSPKEAFAIHQTVDIKTDENGRLFVDDIAFKPTQAIAGLETSAIEEPISLFELMGALFQNAATFGLSKALRSDLALWMKDKELLEKRKLMRRLVLKAMQERALRILKNAGLANGQNKSLRDEALNLRKHKEQRFSPLPLAAKLRSKYGDLRRLSLVQNPEPHVDIKKLLHLDASEPFLDEVLKQNDPLKKRRARLAATATKTAQKPTYSDPAAQARPKAQPAAYLPAA